MNSTLIALALFALFIVYVAAKGRLPQYLSVLFGTVQTDAVTLAPGSTPGTSVSGIVKPITQFAPSIVNAIGWEIPFTGGL